MRGDAQRIAAPPRLPAEAVRQSSGVPEVTVAVGADRHEGASFPKQEPPGAGDLPEDADALGGRETGARTDPCTPCRW